MKRKVTEDRVELPPATVADYNEMGSRISAEEVAAVEAEGLAFVPPAD